MSGGDGLLVVGQQVGRGATEDAEDPVQAGEHTGCSPVPQRDNDPVSAPRQPRHQKDNLAAIDERAVGEVVLQPQSGLGDPGPVHPCITQSPLRFNFSETHAAWCGQFRYIQVPLTFRGLCRRGPFPSNQRPSPPGRRANHRSSGPAEPLAAEPASRSSTAFFTVWCEQPHSSPAAR